MPAELFAGHGLEPAHPAGEDTARLRQASLPGGHHPHIENTGPVARETWAFLTSP